MPLSFGKLLKRSLIVIVSLVIIAFLVCFSIGGTRWRMYIMGKKLAGQLPELSWHELLHMIRPGSGYYLKPVVTERRSLNTVIENPFNTEEDREHGAKIFRSKCALCHGSDAVGDKAPPLTRASYTHGNADWVVYRIIQRGISGTAMQPAGLTERETWEVISFLRAKQLEAEGASLEHGASTIAVDVKADDLLAAAGHPDEWLTYSRTYDGWRFSPLKQINAANVGQLRMLWTRQLSTNDTVVESSPIVAGGAMFVTEPPSNAVAIDVKTGALLWHFVHEINASLSLCCGRVNRGMALLGHTLFLGTLDAHLIALDATSGRIKWEINVADAADGYSITVAPLAIADLVLVGVSGGEFGIQGFLAAYDAETGKEVWRFRTIPGPGEPGHESWTDESWRIGGGPTWVTGAYDPTLDLIYWGVGNPSPAYAGGERSGDNLYTNSAVAVERKTGKLVWYFQFTPHDEHDWDSNQTPILADLDVKGVRRKLILWANRNGFYYVLDRTTGEFLSGTAFVKQTWAKGLDAKGRPIEIEGSRPTEAGTLVFPGVAGGTNWQSAAFQPVTGTVFIPATEGSSVFTKSEPERREPGEIYVASGAATTKDFEPVIKALEGATGKLLWEYRPRRAAAVGGRSGLLATAGGLVLGACEGQLYALDSATGKELWNVGLGGLSAAPPITFSVGGHQVIAVAAGRAVFLFGL